MRVLGIQGSREEEGGCQASPLARFVERVSTSSILCSSLTRGYYGSIPIKSALRAPLVGRALASGQGQLWRSAST